jgi:hypothetical protein
MELQILMRTHSGNPLWEAHLRRLRQLYGELSLLSSGGHEDEDARRSEWAPRPLGRLGRRLFADLDPYLEFFAIARG